MIDGRHTGTGGGNHVTLGGPSAAESPLLQRPDLLKSLLGYWLNHPSLSYLFSGLFIGPTSQHPRIDEARNDALHELEIAFRQIEPLSRWPQTPPWLVDRLFRNLLVDATGNTHRAEFCIDKLFTPESAAGRRGLLEMRAFEMPPHWRMSVAQQALLRGLVSTFWQKPYDKRLSRWGTRLHDDFMLPHFVWQDFSDVLDDLKSAGYRFEPEWFAPHFEFRFPLVGGIAQRGLELELRHALEPWHVLGEEARRRRHGALRRLLGRAPAGQGRGPERRPPLDRLQRLSFAAARDRHCRRVRRGRPLPGLAVGQRAAPDHRRACAADIRHPRHVEWPLDRRLHLSRGPPGGRNYDRMPVNANEAEARRRARFFPIGHTGGPAPEPRPIDNPEHPLTLDLRRA